MGFFPKKRRPSPDDDPGRDIRSEERRGRLEDLVRRFVDEGDDRALVELVDLEFPVLASFLRQRMPKRFLRRVGISDILQETVLKLVRALPNLEYRGEKAFRSYLELLARRALANSLRRERCEKRDLYREEEWIPHGEVASPRPGGSSGILPDPSESLVQVERLESVKRCFARLSDADQAILRLIDEHDLSHEEAAEKLSISTVASRKRYGRAIERLRALLESDGFED